MCVCIHFSLIKIRAVSIGRKFLYTQGFVNLLVYILADILIFHELQKQQILT